MSRHSCERSWQVEAARDGRLDAEALASFELHLTSCARCQAEQQTFDRLAHELSQLGSQVDEMAVRRLRQRTLELANAHMLRAGPPKVRVRVIGYALVACIAVAAAAVFALTRPAASAPTLAAVQVVPQRNTQWHRKLAQNVEQVELSAGTLLFRVARKPSDPRLLVRVPDGEIEDLGTVFSVTVQDGKTREIVVREGRVLFHRRGAAALHLVAGSTWTPPAEPAAESPHEPAPQAPALLPAEPAMPKPKSVAPRTSLVHQDRAASQPVPAGNSEDASYLHILALLREGRSDEARLAAFAYLRTFPTGFRKVEVERVAAMQDDSSTRTDKQSD